MRDLILIAATILAAVAVTVWLVLQWADTMLARQKETLTHQASTTLADMFIFLDPQKMFRYNVAAMVLLPGAIWLFTANPVFTTATLVVTYVLPKYYVAMLRQRRLKTLEKQLPDALLMITGAMTAGASLNVAIESMIKESRPPVSQEFELMARELRMGVDFDSALKNMEKRNPIADFALVIAALRISREIGGNLAEILNALADTLREKQTMEGKIASLTAQGKIQGVVMTGLPLLVMFGLTQLEPVAMAPLFNSWVGWLTLTVIGIMETMGYFFIRQITRIDV
ncbi:MAG: type II secretion system F family protein [Proteobacteria bacterium]|nr:type II secretion system F family protein [Pseudomonadota bacterium]HQR03484.1 type II secretion system F family protein [Rhodocyclaceae bacterium]